METKKLGLLAVTNLTIVALIGTGMFFGPAISASYAGPAALIAWLILGLQTIYVGAIFAELAGRVPDSGGIYTYAKLAYGRFPAFLIGWTMWLVATVTTAILLVAALQYVAPTLSTTLTLMLSIALMLGLNFIAYWGLGATAVALDFFAGALLVFIIVTIVFGVFHIEPGNYFPFFTSPPASLLLALFFILETYFGWESAAFLSDETHDPQRTIPKAILISSVLGAVLGLAFAAVLFGILPASTLANSATPLAKVYSLLFGSLGKTVLVTGIFLALIGSAAGNIITQPRLLMAMSRDKLFIEQFGQKSSKRNTPAKAIVFQSIVTIVVLFAALGNYTLLLSLLIPLALLMYIPTIVSAVILRKKIPYSTFSTPFLYVGAVVASCVFIGAFGAWMIFDANAIPILLFIGALILLSIPIYLFLSTYYNPSTQLFFADALSYPAMFFEKVILPKSVRKKLLSFFSQTNGKTILELGAGVGSLTLHLADAVSASGKIIAIEAGKNNVDLLSKRLRKRGHTHVAVIHDAHAHTRIHPQVHNIDGVFSIGMLGYLQGDKHILAQLADVLPPNAPIIFMEWVDYFNILPDPAWLSDPEALKKEFAKAGFAIHIEKVSGLFWNYLIVHGVKSNAKAFA